MYYIYTVGLSLSGKTWLVNKIKEVDLDHFVVIDTRSIHDFLNAMDPFKDDNTLEGKSLDLRLDFTSEIRNLLIRKFAEKGINIIQDSGNQVKEERMKRVSEVRKIVPDVKTILIYVNTDRKVIENRAIEEDRVHEERGEKPAWHELYKMQIKRIEIPAADEADHFIEYNGKDWKPVVKEIGGIINNASVAQLEEH